MSPFPNADQDPSCKGNAGQTPGPTRGVVGVNGHPTAHQRLSPEMVGDFAQWIDDELEKLQGKHEAFVTPASLRKDLRRER